VASPARGCKLCAPPNSPSYINRKHPSESLQPPPPQFIRIHTLVESNKTRLKNKNKKKNEYKNRNMDNKNRFFQCFRPVTMDGRGPVKRLRRPDGPGEPAFKYIAMGEMEGMVFPKILPPDLAADIDKEEGDGGRREKSSNGRLSRILKSVLSGTSSVSTFSVYSVWYSVLWMVFSPSLFLRFLDYIVVFGLPLCIKEKTHIPQSSSLRLYSGNIYT